MSDKNIILSDPLNELALPTFAQKLNINHHSATQWSKCDGAWLYEYLVLNQAERRALLLSNAAMKSGVCVNNVLQNYYSNIIWKFGPQGKLTPVKNEKEKDKQKIIQEEIEQLKNYEPVDEKDRQKKEKYIDEVSSIIANGFLALELLISPSYSVVSEEQISVDQSKTNLLMSIVGRTDFRLCNAGGDLSTTPSSEPFYTAGIVELKTSYSKAGKLKANGERSFIAAKVPAHPSLNHLVQVAMYAAAYNYSVPVYLVYLTKDEYKIFDSSNCKDLTQEGLKRNFKILCNTFKRRENLLSQFENLSREEIIKNAVSLIDPQFSHPFAWSNLPEDLLKHAKEMWNYE